MARQETKTLKALPDRLVMNRDTMIRGWHVKRGAVVKVSPADALDLLIFAHAADPFDASNPEHKRGEAKLEDFTARPTGGPSVAA